MYEPIRGGTRGGQAEFKWADVSADKDREHYLGHSINAPTGRWQKNKDVHWYGRDAKTLEDERISEIQHIKQLEADALAVALGFEPAQKEPATGKPSSSEHSGEADEKALQRASEKEEKRRRKAEKREEKHARRERKARERGEEPDGHQQPEVKYRSRSLSPRHRDHTRSHSPRRRSKERNYPPRSSPNRPSHYRSEQDRYNSDERERERERDRRRWDMSVRRELPARRH